jgi:hypothetical protein
VLGGRPALSTPPILEMSGCGLEDFEEEVCESRKCGCCLEVWDLGKFMAEQCVFYLRACAHQDYSN